MTSILVRRITRDLVIRRATRSIVIRRSGIPGPAGGSGGGISPFEYIQVSAASVWTINHNFGRRPVSVRCVTPGGIELEGGVFDATANQTIVDFKSAQAGRAYLI